MDNEKLLEQLMALFKKQKELAKSSAERKGQKPTQKASRAELAHQFSHALQTDFPMVRQTVIGYSYPPCIVPLAELRPITIDELELETVHRGRVLVVRTFGHPSRLQAVHNAIEDSTRAVDRLAVYNFETELEASEVLPKGQIVAIKEPYYKVTADGGHTVRIDHPTDLVNLRPEDDMVPLELQPKLMELVEKGPAYWKGKGNTAFKARDYRNAIDLYSRGIATAGEKEDDSELLRRDMYRNRAQANIYLKRFEAALSDAEAALVPPDALTHNPAELTKCNVKAHHRAGIASYNLQDYGRAKDNFEATLKLAPIDADAERELQRTKNRTMEKELGEYDFEAMINYAMTVDKRLNSASFTKKVTVQETDDRGHGLFTAKDIKTGELILCEKALCVAFNTNEGGDQSVILNLNTEVMSVGTHPARLVGVVQKLMHSPKLAQEFMGLYDGGYKPRGVSVVDDIVAVDTFQVEAALDFNGFGCPSVPSSVNSDIEDRATSSTGAWLTSSFVNHDCTGNAARSFIGDMMVIRATKDLKKGDEILMRYKNSDDDVTKFQEELQKSWKFKCSCAVCIAEAKTPEGQRKRRLDFITEAKTFIKTNEINEQYRATPNLIAKAEQLRVKIEASYDKALFKDLPRQGLLELDFWICTAHIFGSQSKLQKAALAVLSDLGFKVNVKKGKMSIDRTNARVHVAGIHAGMYLARSYLSQGQKELGEQIKEFTKEMYKTIHGCMVGFEKRVGEFEC